MKRQGILHTYGQEDEDEDEEIPDPAELQHDVEMSLSAGAVHAPAISGDLPEVNEEVEIDTGGKGCKRCGSLTHKRSNHKDCPYNKRKA